MLCLNCRWKRKREVENQKQYENAQIDLNEALEIALSGGMKRYLVDYHIEKGKVEKEMGEDSKAEEHFRIASLLIDETGYERKRECLKCAKVTKVH